jgi:hypothetical protein
VSTLESLLEPKASWVAEPGCSLALHPFPSFFSNSQVFLMDGGRYEACDQGVGIGIGGGITPFLWVWEKKLLSAIS